MAKLVYDPTVDRQARKGVKVFTASPKPGEEPQTIAFDSKVPPKGKATIKKAKREEKAAEPEKPKAAEPKFSDEQFIEALKTIGHPATSREVSDKLGFDPDKGRAIVRRTMERLIAEKKVVAVKPESGRAKELYALP